MEKKLILDNFGRQTYFGHRAGAQGILYIFFPILTGPGILAMFSRGPELDRPEPDRPEPDRPEPDRTGVTSAEQRLPIMDHGSWIKDHGSKINDQVSRIKDQRSSIEDQRSTIKYQGSWIKDHGSRIMDQVSRIKDLGPWTLFWHE